jgi:acetylornithine deacetylase/succinyl-diaminopimelate desuccinylase-like protein
MDHQATQKFVDEVWMDAIVPELVEYIKIPNKSPHFDPDWEKNGYMEDAVQQVFAWCSKQDIPGMKCEIVRLPGRTPLIFIDIPGEGDDTILLYGHLDKQPEMTGWADDLGPWKPVIKGDKLYGRGGADDGYAAYGSLTAIMAVQREKLPHARCVVIIEACEESGSYDLPHYIEHLRDRIGQPSLVVCLDSGAGNYEQLWLTVSLRGMAAGTLRADVLTEGVHSGYASGVVPSSFRVIRQLLSRLEDERTGKVLPDYLLADIPEQRIEQTRRMAGELGDAVFEAYPFCGGVQPQADNNVERLLNRTWRPALSVTGAEGLPTLDSAGNVLRPYTAVKLSMRLPPTVDGESGAGVAGGVRARRDVHGRRGHDPLHGHVGRVFSPGPVHDHRRARAQFECPRPERVPARAVRPQTHFVRGPGHRGPLPARRGLKAPRGGVSAHGCRTPSSRNSCSA